MNIDILGISELKWTGMGEFNSDDQYIYNGCVYMCVCVYTYIYIYFLIFFSIMFYHKILSIDPCTIVSRFCEVLIMANLNCDSLLKIEKHGIFLNLLLFLFIQICIQSPRY